MPIIAFVDLSEHFCLSQHVRMMNSQFQFFFFVFFFRCLHQAACSPSLVYPTIYVHKAFFHHYANTTISTKRTLSFFIRAAARLKGKGCFGVVSSGLLGSSSSKPNAWGNPDTAGTTGHFRPCCWQREHKPPQVHRLSSLPPTKPPAASPSTQRRAALCRRLSRGLKHTLGLFKKQNILKKTQPKNPSELKDPPKWQKKK